MSLKLAAQHLASKGRGPDTTLVHMAPQEVAGLQALARAHGGTLTTNPDTGLPEAGFLRAILPMVAGAALGPAGLGLTAMQAGLAAGALGTLATGSLSRGLMAGLGAYGGAGLMGSVMGAGTGALSASAVPAVTGADFAGQAASLSGDAAAALNPGAVAPAAVAPAAVAPAAVAPVPFNAMPIADQNVLAQSFGADMYPAAATAAPSSAAASAAQAAAPSAGAGTLTGADFAGQAQALSNENMMQRAVTDRLAAATPMDKFSAGIKAIGDKPDLLFNKGNLKYGLAAAAPLMFQEPEKRAGYEGSGPNPYQYEYDPGRQAYTASSGSSEQMFFDPRYRRLADGGLAALSGGGASHLGDYSDGGRLLRGPGDGVSDDIPATIADKRPARLADGEFVVPARIVSELGNGSTEAGARKLYAMMDRVQKARSKTVGKNRVAVNSRADKLLPA
jgi:hypothetical protein